MRLGWPFASVTLTPRISPRGRRCGFARGEAALGGLDVIGAPRFGGKGLRAAPGGWVFCGAGSGAARLPVMREERDDLGGDSGAGGGREAAGGVMKRLVKKPKIDPDCVPASSARETGRLDGSSCGEVEEGELLNNSLRFATADWASGLTTVMPFSSRERSPISAIAVGVAMERSQNSGRPSRVDADAASDAMEVGVLSRRCGALGRDEGTARAREESTGMPAARARSARDNPFAPGATTAPREAGGGALGLSGG